ncbi:hypothetical protein [Pararhodonellum marinum]|uniref:hypothetical protein n=1 Tax=Pararhodonellum marinum TaxID=2755358 RepID=UPI00188E845A|nr:hypothetical protein [Pararhodonellum marinum]
MENVIVLQKRAVVTEEKAAKKIKVAPIIKKSNFYLKRRCLALYGMAIIGMVLMYVQWMYLGTLVALLSLGLVFILKDLDEAFSIDLNFKPEDSFNENIKRDLEF